MRLAPLAKEIRIPLSAPRLPRRIALRQTRAYAPACRQVSCPAMQFEDARTKTEDALAKGDARAALNVIRFQLGYPAALDERQWPEALGLFARIAAAFAGDEWAQQVWKAVRNPSDVRSLYDLGYALIEQSLHDVASGVLGRANALRPGTEPIVTELVVALEHTGQNAAALDVLRSSGLVYKSPVCTYLLGFNALMTTDVETARAALRRIEGVGDTNIAAMAQTLREFIARAEAVRGATALDTIDLRGWHFVVTGGLLLHLSPFGFDEGMRGRYA